MNVDYDAPADFFAARSRKGGAMRYRRFVTAAEAIRFAIEQLPAPMLIGAYHQVEGERFGGDQIRELYDSAAYPFARAT